MCEVENAPKIVSYDPFDLPDQNNSEENIIAWKFVAFEVRFFDSLTTASLLQQVIVILVKCNSEIKTDL